MAKQTVSIIGLQVAFFTQIKYAYCLKTNVAVDIYISLYSAVSKTIKTLFSM